MNAPWFPSMIKVRTLSCQIQKESALHRYAAKLKGDVGFFFYNIELETAEKVALVPGSGQIINRDNIIK